MPEIKKNFTTGKMNRDLDERLIPEGEYRYAMNVQVSSTEDSDVGTAQNILGNEIVNPLRQEFIPEDSICVASIADEKNDTLYWFTCSVSNSKNLIIQYKDNTVTPVFVDTATPSVLNFNPGSIITGVNIIDGMLFWTDGYYDVDDDDKFEGTEPKKINIKRCIQGTHPNGNQHTVVVNDELGYGLGGTVVDMAEEHITVIKKGPKRPPKMELITSRDTEKYYTGVMNIAINPDSDSAKNHSTFIMQSADDGHYDFSGFSVGDTFYVELIGAISAGGVEVNQSSNWKLEWDIGTKVVIKEYDDDGDPPGLPITDYVIKGVIDEEWNWNRFENELPPNGPAASTHTDYYQNLDSGQWKLHDHSSANGGWGGIAKVRIKIVAITGFPEGVDTSQNATNRTRKYAIDLWDEEEKLYEFKFPRFATRYKYEDGEYSPFSPFTEVAFLPGSFDYHPRKGYNLGMTNRVTEIILEDLVTSNMPKDVVSIDILHKDEQSPNVYIVDTIKPNDDPVGSVSGLNYWYEANGRGRYVVKEEVIKSAVQSNQTLRHWDNVPRKALAQDITGNRIVYGNYLQNYTLKNIDDGKNYIPEFRFSWDTFGQTASGTRRSIKSLREYQLGVVFTDEYGRETPVISNTTGTKKLEKDLADNPVRFKVKLGGQYPDGMKYMKFFVKQTSGEYYNLAMDRFYDAEDGNVWIAFPSSDRNKIDIDSFLILKKGTDSDELVTEAARYKVVAIENEAPDFIKTKKTKIVEVGHYLTTSGANTNDLYGTGLGGAPINGTQEFTINYQPFHGSSGAQLHRMYTGSERVTLYIEWSIKGEAQKTERYRISELTCDLDENDMGGTIANSKYHVTLDKRLGDDLNFITDDDTGQNSNRIQEGVITTIYKYKVENSPKFDGRFFVKLHKDEVFQKNIQPAFAGETEYMRKAVRKVYSMTNNFIHGENGDLSGFTNSKQNPLKTGIGLLSHGWSYFSGMEWNYKIASSNTPHDPIMTTWAHGIYGAQGAGRLRGGNRKRWTGGGSNEFPANFRPFASFATWFRDYTTQPENVYNRWGNMHPNQPSERCVVVGKCPKSEYSGTGRDYFIPHPAHNHSRWYKEWDGYTGEVLNGHCDKGTKNNFTNTADNNAKEWDVWFIDFGPFIGSRYNNSLYWGGITHNGIPEENYLGATGKYFTFSWGFQTLNASNFNRDVTHPTFGFNWGIKNYANSYRMRLSYGGIYHAQSDNPDAVEQPFRVPDFYGIGKYNGEPSNPHYDDGDMVSWVNLLNPGNVYRWRENPNKTLYTISTGVNTQQQQRYAVKITDTDKRESHGLRNCNNGLGIISNLNTNSKNCIIAARDPWGVAPTLSPNHTKSWDLLSTPALEWDPTDRNGFGHIVNGVKMRLNMSKRKSDDAIVENHSGSMDVPIEIYVQTLEGTNINSGTNETVRLAEGMALMYVHDASDNQDDDLPGASYLDFIALPGTGNNDLLLIDSIENSSTIQGPSSGGDGYIVRLVGCRNPLGIYDMTLAASGYAYNATSADCDKWVFVQPKMNGYSVEAARRISFFLKRKLGAVGYHMEFVEEVEPEEILPENPAIFETEPKDIAELDIYHEASGSIPIILDDSTIDAGIPIGSLVSCSAVSPVFIGEVIGYQNDNEILVDSNPTGINANDTLNVITPNNIEFNINITNVGTSPNFIELDSRLFSSSFSLNWSNCYSFGNGVESNRIRDNFNLPFITSGVKASTTLEDYKEEHRQYGLIYSGIYNSTSGINNLNQFIAGEKITKDINPIYGSIQKLHSRDTDLVTLCEDKVLKILANKDAVFNADGNTNLTATENVLGQTVPFSGEHGISKNPESFASEAYRAYFTDKIRGTVMRLSRDGLTPISEHGMKEWFKDNLKLGSVLLGGYDDKKDQYNLTIEGDEDAHTLTFKENVTGWVSFKSFIPEHSVSMANDYYTFKEGKLYIHHSENVDRNTFYNEFTPSNLTVILNNDPSNIKAFNTVNYEGSQARISKFVEQNIGGRDYTDQAFYNLIAKEGWFAEDIETNEQDGFISEFIEKEGKWFNYIRGNQLDQGDKPDTSEFSFQGIGLSIANNPPSWDCDANFVCFDPQTGLGQYSTLASCEANCPPPSWNCNTTTGVCYDPGDGTGFWTTQAQCQANCWEPSWNCVNFQCIDPGNGSGQYSTLASCQSACSVPPSWDCGPAGCYDPGNGQGQYNTLAACQIACLNSKWQCEPLTGICNEILPTDSLWASLTAPENQSLAACNASCGTPGCMDNGSMGQAWWTANYPSTIWGPDYQVNTPANTPALNYNPNATTDDGSCIYSSWDCVNLSGVGNTCEEQTMALITACSGGNPSLYQSCLGQYATLTECTTSCAITPPPCETNWAPTILITDDSGNTTSGLNFDGQMDATGNIPNWQTGDTWIYKIEEVTPTNYPTGTYWSGNIAATLNATPYTHVNWNVNIVFGASIYPGTYILTITHYQHMGTPSAIGECAYQSQFTIGQGSGPAQISWTGCCIPGTQEEPMIGPNGLTCNNDSWCDCCLDAQGAPCGDPNSQHAQNFGSPYIEDCWAYGTMPPNLPPWMGGTVTGQCCTYPTCFVAGTKIIMEDNSRKNIENVKTGDIVKSWDEITGTIDNNKVIMTSQQTNDNMVKLSFGDIEIKNTFDHPYYVENKGWCSYKPKLTTDKYNIGDVKQLEVGDTCYKYNDGLLEKIVLTKATEDLGEVQTYIFKVENDSTFFANDILVHNK